jgi:hypothetical protein
MVFHFNYGGYTLQVPQAFIQEFTNESYKQWEVSMLLVIEIIYC